MTDATDGPAATATDPAGSITDANALPGFSPEMIDFGHPLAGLGHPEATKAVETDTKGKAPEAGADTPPAEKPETPEAAADTPEPKKPINFDDFGKLKPTWEKLYNEGKVTKEDVEEARKGYLRQDAWSRKTDALAREREAFAAERERIKEDLEILQKIRSDNRTHEAFLKAARGELTATEESGDGDQLADLKTVDQRIDARLEAREREQAARTAREQAAYDAKQGAVIEVLAEAKQALGISKEQLRDYLTAEELTLPVDVDPITYFPPSELRRRIELRHEAETAKAEAAALREELSKRTAKDARTSKQSSAPAPRIVDTSPQDPWTKTMRELNLSPDMGGVQGFGLR